MNFELQQLYAENARLKRELAEAEDRLYHVWRAGRDNLYLCDIHNRYYHWSKNCSLCERGDVDPLLWEGDQS